MGENCPKLLDLIPKEKKKWGLSRESGEERRSSCDENKKLELRLGLPGDHPWSCSSGYQRMQKSQIGTKESTQSQPCCSRIVELQNTAVLPNTSQKRAAPAPVVGWPPIRSFRKNLATSSSTKLASESHDPTQTKPVNEKPAIKNSHKGLFVKINMDGVPIGRKVDLVAYDSYDKLSSTVDELFRGLLAAQNDSPAGGIDTVNKQEQKPITGLLDGSGEYTLVYEDNEGDRMLVGDVPWHMFVSTVKRLRVLKSSDIPTLGCGGSKESKMRVESALN